MRIELKKKIFLTFLKINYKRSEKSVENLFSEKFILTTVVVKLDELSG